MKRASDKPKTQDWINGELNVAIATNMWFRVQELIEDEGADIHHNNDSALRSAAFTGIAENIRWLLDRGADIDAQNGEPLFEAIRRKRTGAARLLIERGADIDIVRKRMQDDRRPDLLRKLDALAEELVPLRDKRRLEKIRERIRKKGAPHL